MYHKNPSVQRSEAHHAQKRNETIPQKNHPDIILPNLFHFSPTIKPQLELTLQTTTQYNMAPNFAQTLQSSQLMRSMNRDDPKNISFTTRLSKHENKLSTLSLMQLCMAPKDHGITFP